MEWVIFALGAAMTWAVVNIIDKFFLSTKRINPYAIVFLMGTLGSLILIPIWLFVEITFSAELLSIMIIITILRFVGLFFYAKCVESTEVSRSLGLLYIQPIFVAILSAIVLSEILTSLNYLGIIIVVLGAILLSIKGLKDLSIRKATKYALISAFLYGTGMVGIKYLLQFLDFWSVYFWVGLMFIPLSFFVLLKKQARSGVKRFLNLGKRYVGLYTFIEIIGALGAILSIIAISLGPVSLVATVHATQPFFVLIFAILISMFAPHIIKEDISKGNVFRKFIGILLIIFGTFLVI